ncbi:hypothetical protein Tco_1090513 [Tanacetum coccineum]|uniref:Uncharacterized protein n=1 Tax=Tanacetum coccineum TaxID=301880 RepID=A0ABQ5I5S0_9ASTR
MTIIDEEDEKENSENQADYLYPRYSKCEPPLDVYTWQRITSRRNDLSGLIRRKDSDGTVVGVNNYHRLLLGFKRLHGFLEVTTAQRLVISLFVQDYCFIHNTSRFGINKRYQSFALRNFDLEDIQFESTNSGTTAKLPILKLGEYEMWVIRIKQYFQIQDYALWEVIENGDSWVSVPQTTQENGTSVTKMSIPVTAEEKTNKKNDVKARGLLLMALPNEHQTKYTHDVENGVLVYSLMASKLVSGSS